MTDTDRNRILWTLRVAQAVLEAVLASDDVPNPDELAQDARDAQCWRDLLARINAADEIRTDSLQPAIYAPDIDDLCERVNCEEVERETAFPEWIDCPPDHREWKDGDEILAVTHYGGKVALVRQGGLWWTSRVRGFGAGAAYECCDLARYAILEPRAAI